MDDLHASDGQATPSQTSTDESSTLEASSDEQLQQADQEGGSKPTDSNSASPTDAATTEEKSPVADLEAAAPELPNEDRQLGSEPAETFPALPEDFVSPAVEAANKASEPYVGQWNQLISTTNWEKGRIICEWRDELIKNEAPTTEYSDEAWAKHVGGVTGQHVGRLRRVYQRFGEDFSKYEGLYWSHFQAAIDWDDAEMWLEGAVQSSWSVSQMRRTRWETLGSQPELEPRDEEVVVADLDEDFSGDTASATTTQKDRDPNDYSGPAPEGPDFGDEPAPMSEEGGASIYMEDDAESISFVRPFENLPDLPDDVAEAFEAFKLVVLRHKAENWEQISKDDLLASLEALKELAQAPSADDAM